MTSQLYVSKIADGGEIELTAFVPQKGSPFFDHNTSLVELGHRFANGEASQGTFKLQDPAGEFPAADGSFNLAAHKLVTWTEDASGDQLWLSRGRVSSFEVGRGKFTLDNVIEVDAVVDDCNVDLGFLAFTEEWERPQEAGWDRVAALHAYILNGASSTSPTFRGSTDVYFADSHLAPNTARVTMPAKTYPVGTQPGEVVRECADIEGKVWGVVIHHLGGSHLCLRYHAEDNHAVHPSPIKISDDLADWDPEDLATPVFEPHWEMGKASIWDSQELITGLVSTWGPEQIPIFVENSGSVDDYEYWIDSFSDSESTTQEQAWYVANAMLDYRAASNITHRVSIIMLPEQLGLITVGQSLDIKAAAAMAGHFLGAYQLRRVAELTFEPRTDGRYWAHMHLDRVVRRRPARRGTPPAPPKPPASDSPPGAVDQFEYTSAGSTLDATPTNMVDGSTTTYDIVRLRGQGAVIFRSYVTPTAITGYHLEQGAAGVEAATRSGWRVYYSDDFTPGNNAHVTGTWAEADNAEAFAAVASVDRSMSAGAHLGWKWVSTVYDGGGPLQTDWCVRDFSFTDATAGDTSEDIVAPGDETTGTAGCDTYACVDHTHAHPNLTTGGPFHNAASVTFTPTGTIAATDVQAAIAEVASEAAAAGAPNTADYLVGTAQAGLSAEIVVGATPGGELSGTWAAPTVDATHSGSAHADFAAGVGELLIADVHSTPLVFDDILQNDDGDNFLYADA